MANGTDTAEGKFIIQAIHCYGGAGSLTDSDDNPIAAFDGEGTLVFWRKAFVDGLKRTGAGQGVLYVYLDASY
jgi:hypothetical protein